METCDVIVLNFEKRGEYLSIMRDREDRVVLNWQLVKNEELSHQQHVATRKHGKEIKNIPQHTYLIPC